MLNRRGVKLISLAMVLLLGCMSVQAQAVAPFELGVDWSAQYDVIIVGFGAAGAAAAITAAQEGAQVLLLEKAPEGFAGGNSAVCMQWAAMVDDKEQAVTYIKSMRGGFETPTDEMIQVYVDGIADNERWLNALGAPKVTKYFDWIEFPDMEGAGGIHLVTVDGNTGIPSEGLASGKGLKPSGALYKFLKKRVESFENIDIWYEAPAVHLVQDRATGIVHGVQALISGEKVLLRARNGVVLCCGGYENNARMLEDYNDVHGSASLGYALYNTGDGIVMAQEAGARLWHMASIVWPNTGYRFESGAVTFGATTSAGMLVGGDGALYKSAGASKHGKAYFYGNYVQALYPDVTYAIFDQNSVGIKQIHNSFSEGNKWEIEHGYFEKADSIQELSSRLGLDSEALNDSVKEYNETSQYPLLKAPFYAIKISHAVCNTQGGPERGLGGEIISLDGKAIPHLYEAGEMGDIWSHCYQASCNIGGGLAYGRIAGKNAAAPKDDVYQGSVMEGKTPYAPSAKQPAFPLGEGQFLGEGNGKGAAPMTVRVTLKEGHIAQVELLEDFETPGLTDRAKQQVIAQIIERDTPYVDIVAGCTMTSAGIMEAVNNAVSQAR